MDSSNFFPNIQLGQITERGAKRISTTSREIGRKFEYGIVGEIDPKLSRRGYSGRFTILDLIRFGNAIEKVL